MAGLQRVPKGQLADHQADTHDKDTKANEGDNKPETGPAAIPFKPYAEGHERDSDDDSPDTVFKMPPMAETS
jgi:hypothetical protein